MFHTERKLVVHWNKNWSTVRDEKGDLIAWFPPANGSGVQCVEAQGNAHLFTAAHEMLTVLEGLIADNAVEYIPTRLWDAARAAVAKAKGEHGPY